MHATDRLLSLRPVGRDREETVRRLLAGLELSEGRASGAVADALKAKEWERAANLLETTPGRAPRDENDLGCALAHVAGSEAEVWMQAAAALERCIEAVSKKKDKSNLAKRAGRNLEIVKRAGDVARPQ
jgi:hypothetical protein